MRSRSFISKIKDSVAILTDLKIKGSRWFWRKNLFPQSREKRWHSAQMATWETPKGALDLSQSSPTPPWSRHLPRSHLGTIWTKASFQISTLMRTQVIRKLTLVSPWCHHLLRELCLQKVCLLWGWIKRLPWHQESRTNLVHSIRPFSQGQEQHSIVKI